MTYPILTVIPVSAADATIAQSLLSHISTHGPILNHAVLFVADKGIPSSIYAPLADAAKAIFPAGGNLIFTPIQVAPAYPNAHNLRFETAARHVESFVKTPWIFLSPRCVPRRKGWLAELESEYWAHANKFPVMGQVLTPAENGTAQPLVSSTALYPASLPKRVFQRLVAQRGTDFEKSCADLLVPLTHPTKLIWIHPVDGGDALPTPPGIVSLVHTARAREYAASLRGEVPAPVAKAPVPVVQEVPPERIVPPPSKPNRYLNPPLAAPPRSTYYHSGDLGDIIYALAAIRLAGGGKLLLGPRSLRTPPPANPMRQDQFDRFHPLLAAQPYLTHAVFSPNYPGTAGAFDLNRFREQWGDKGLRERTGIKTLVRMHCHLLGVDEKFHPSDTWITVPNPIVTGMFTVHRSPRYRSTEDNAFPWPLIVKRYAKRLLFVGLATEHADFQRQFGVRVAFWSCVDFLEMARLIAGSLGFIGNQSFPNAIALGCGQRVLQESWATSPDCVLSRENFLTQPFNESRLDAWERSKPPTRTIETQPIPKPIEIETPAPITEHYPTRRLVSSTLVHGNAFELGPQIDAPGLGDTLCVTPLAAALGKRAVMLLSPEISRFAPLFNGLCPTRIVDDPPVFPNPGKERFIESKLRMFGFQCEDGKTLPIVKLTHGERVHAGRWANSLKSEKPLLIYHTACAQKWAHIRSRPVEWFAPIRSELEKHFTLIEENLSNPTPIRTLAARYGKVGRYFGVNTGNWHLAMAVGCRCLVIDAEECDGYNPALWRYTVPSVEYSGFNHDNILSKIPWLTRK